MTKQTNKAVVKNTPAAAIENKEVIVAAPAVAPAVVIVTKADKARSVFAEAYPDGKNTIMQRKDIISKMISDAGLTKAGAATYLQNMKKKAGIVQAKVTSVPQTA